MRKIDKKTCPDGLTKERNEIDSALSTDIDFSKIKDEWKYGQITEQQIEFFMESVADCLLAYYNYSTRESALIAVKQSTFSDVIRKFPEQTLCYGERYWAEDIIEELKELESK